MASYPGSGADFYSLENYSYQGTVGQPELVETYFDHEDDDISYGEVSTHGYGSNAHVTPGMPGTAHSGVIAYGFSNDYYNRIHIYPNPVEFGSLLEETDITVEFWNAFFTSTTWQSQVETGFVGLQFDSDDVPPPDVVMTPLANHLATLTAFPDGPATLAANVSFTMLGRTVQDLVITGRRSKLFPFIASWQKNPKETFEWKTNIVETEEWGETRYRVREHPRRSFQFQIGAVATGAADARVSLLSWQANDYGLPLWMYESNLTLGTTPGDTTIFLDTTYSDFVVGGQAVIFQGPGYYETVAITEIQSDRLILDPNQAVSSTWGVNTPVYPIRLTRFSDQISMSSQSPGDVSATLNLKSLASETNFGSHGFSTYKGFPLLDWRPNWKSPRKVSYHRKVDVEDNGTAVPEYFDLSPRYGEQQEFEWFLNGREAVDRFKALMSYMAGRHKPIWVPSWHNDFPFSGDYTDGLTLLPIKNNFGSKLWLANITDPIHLRLYTIAGDSYCDKITNAVEHPTYEGWDNLTISTGWATIIPHNFIDNVCLLTLVRLLSDSVQLEWYTPQVARARTIFVYVPEQPE